MRAILVMAALITALVMSCTSDDSGESVPPIDQASAADLQARAFERACRDVICAGAPILAPASISDDVRQQISQFTDEVQYLTGSQLAEQASVDGRFEAGATMIGVEEVQITEQADVRRVDVSISRGPADFSGRTYLFRWDGSAWLDTSPDAADVTVTTSVS